MFMFEKSQSQNQTTNIWDSGSSIHIGYFSVRLVDFSLGSFRKMSDVNVSIVISTAVGPKGPQTPFLFSLRYDVVGEKKLAAKFLGDLPFI